MDVEENLVPLCVDCHQKIHVRGASNFIGFLQKLRIKRLKWLAPDFSQTITNTKPSFSGTTVEDQEERNFGR